MNDVLSDEERLLRLFHCLNANEQAELLKNVAVRLLKRYPVENCLRYQNPKLEAKLDLTESLPERLYRIIPYRSYLTDLHDYDFHPAEVAWQDDVVEVLLGSSASDSAYADSLVDAYIDGAKKYSVPLASELGCTEDEMIQASTEEARNLIHAWREAIIAVLEEGSGAACKTRESINDNNV